MQAQRWLGRDQEAQLKGDALVKALGSQPWDDSVKSLVPFPDVLKMMSDELEWTQHVGDALLAQQQDVLNAMQVLRGRAQQAGKLQSGPQQTIEVTENTPAAPAAGRRGSSTAPARHTAPAPPPPPGFTRFRRRSKLLRSSRPSRTRFSCPPTTLPWYTGAGLPSYPPAYYPPPAASYPVGRRALDRHGVRRRRRTDRLGLGLGEPLLGQRRHKREPGKQYQPVGDLAAQCRAPAGSRLSRR